MFCLVQGCSAVLRHAELPSVRGKATTRADYRKDQLKAVPEGLLGCALFLCAVWWEFGENCYTTHHQQKANVTVRQLQQHFVDSFSSIFKTIN